MRGFGIEPTTAAEALQRTWPPNVPTQPLPAGTAGAVGPEKLGIATVPAFTFFVLGDHGGVKEPAPQNAVASAMGALERPAFVYSLGDVVYFNGDPSEYHPQFYEAYAHLPVPFVAIPGNHDGDTSDDPTRKPLDTFMANFCDTSPRSPAGSEEYGRDTQTQPYCDWTLRHPAVTIIGLYSNVPSGGHLEPSQVTWLAEQLKGAPSGVPLVVALHHPPYSIDAHHGGSDKMGKAIDEAVATAGRWPDLVLSGHVHDYQRFTRQVNLPDGPTGPYERKVAYVVSGNGGYHNLHKLAPGAKPGDELAPGVVFEAGDDASWGFLTVGVSAGKLSVQAVAVPLVGAPTVVDQFEV